eukprot:763940-Hanusia_phi.AAC.15
MTNEGKENGDDVMDVDGASDLRGREGGARQHRRTSSSKSDTGSCSVAVARDSSRNCMAGEHPEEAQGQHLEERSSPRALAWRFRPVDERRAKDQVVGPSLPQDLLR